MQAVDVSYHRRDVRESEGAPMPKPTVKMPHHQQLRYGRRGQRWMHIGTPPRIGRLAIEADPAQAEGGARALASEPVQMA